MIEEVFFTSMIPALDGKYTRQDRFGSDEGWIIEVDGASVTLRREARQDCWWAVDAFTVVGVPFVYRRRAEAVEPKARKRS